MLIYVIALFQLVSITNAMYFTTIPSAFIYPGDNGTIITEETTFDPQLLSVARRVVSEHYISNYTCDLQPVSVRCIIGRDLPYVYPYQCRIHSPEHKKSQLDVVYLPLYEPNSRLFIDIPFVYDKTVISELNSTELAEQPSTPKDIQVSDEPGNDTFPAGCPCNCRVDCNPPSKLKQISSSTICADCKCLMRDIECYCLDKYDLEFAWLEPQLREFIEYHPRYKKPDPVVVNGTVANSTTVNDTMAADNGTVSIGE